MGISDLQSHFVQNTSDAGFTEPVDLTKLPDRRTRDSNFQLVIDGECCLDRLYGGYFPDWVCGGQWNKMDQFLCNFATATQTAKLDLVVFLNGSLEPERLNEWCKRQENTYKYLQEINQHINMKRKPPPKVWWVPPAFLRSAIRIGFRSLNMKIMCSLEDHHKEVLRFIKKNRFKGVIADDSEYLIFEPGRYFSAHKLKLTFKGALETVELKLEKVFSDLNIPKDRVNIFATLLGNHIVTEKDLSAFYSTLDIQESQQPKSSAVIAAVAQFVRTLETTDRSRVVDIIIEKSHTESATYDFLHTFRLNLLWCLKYYGGLNAKHAPNPMNKVIKPAKTGIKEKSAITEEAENGRDESELENAPSVAEAAASAVLPSDNQLLDDTNVFEDGDGKNGGAKADCGGAGDSSYVQSVSGIVVEKSAIANGHNGSGDAPTSQKTQENTSSLMSKLLYRVLPQIEHVAVSRHASGLMSPYICQILKYKEIKLPVIIEDINDNSDLPRTHLVYRPLRQRIYAILFNLHHLHFLAKGKGEPVPKIEVKETYFDPATKSVKSDVVRAVEVGWGVPTVERLWLGDGDECKRKRVRAFLSIMKSDKQIFLNASVVPQNLLVLCCVLRFLVYEKKLLRLAEVDGLIAQALIQQLTDPNLAQDIEVLNLRMRGIHISHLFMEGVEMALLVNDACGSPIPYMLFAPWLFFNGKIFNFILEEQANGKTIAEICGFKMDIVHNMEKLKSIILDGISVSFASDPNLLTTTVPVPFLNSLLKSHYGRIPCQFTQGSHQTPSVPLRRSAGGVAPNLEVLRNPLNGGVSRQYGEENSFAVPRNPRNSTSMNGGGSRRGPTATRNADLHVAGQVVARYNQSPNFDQSPYASFDRVPRNPYGYDYASSSLPLDFRRMQISQGNKMPNRGSHSNGSNSTGRNKSEKPQSSKHQTLIVKKNDSFVPSSQIINGGAAIGCSRINGVSFIDEPHSILTTRNGSTLYGIPE